VIVLAAVVLAVGMVAAGLLMSRGRDRLLRERLCDKVVITLKTGPSFSGVLFKVDDRAVILRDTQALGAAHNGDHLAVDGELVLFRTDIEFLQRP
jgi:hypothetical protein